MAGPIGPDRLDSVIVRRTIYGGGSRVGDFASIPSGPQGRYMPVTGQLADAPVFRIENMDVSIPDKDELAPENHNMRISHIIRIRCPRPG